MSKLHVNIKCLKRRARFLQDRINANPEKDLSFDVAEASSIRNVLSILYELQHPTDSLPVLVDVLSKRFPNTPKEDLEDIVDEICYHLENRSWKKQYRRVES